MYEHRSHKLLTPREFRLRVLKHGSVVAALLAGSLIVGIAGYMTFAHMRFVDAFLNACMLLGGMGPMGDLPNDTAKYFAGFYALYSGIVFIAAAGVLVAPFAHRIFHKLSLERGHS
jgi:hypothetical protein